MVAVAVAALPLGANAQARTGLWLEPAQVPAGGSVRIHVDFGAAQPWCGLHVDFGDGRTEDAVVERFPLVLGHAYARPGRYVVRAEGRAMARGLRSAAACTGAVRQAVLRVDAPSAAADGPPRTATTQDDGRARRDDEAARERARRDDEAARERTRREDDAARERARRIAGNDRERATPDVDDDARGRRGVPPAPPRPPPAPAPAGAPDLTLRSF